MSHLDIRRDPGHSSQAGLPSRQSGLPDCITVFQPIVHTEPPQRIFAYEALTRGAAGEGAADIFAAVPAERLHEFDAWRRLQAIELAKNAGVEHRLSLNVLGGAICDPRYGLVPTIEAATTLGFPISRLIFEITETEKIVDIDAARDCLWACKQSGAQIAIDDIGTAFNSFEMLIGMSPDYIKLGMKLTGEILTNAGYRPFFVKLVKAFQAIGVGIIAEGLETLQSVEVLQSLGIEMMQGYYFGFPSPSFAGLDHD